MLSGFVLLGSTNLNAQFFNSCGDYHKEACMRSENKRYNMEMRKLRAGHDKSFKKEVEKNKAHMERLKDENVGKIKTLETELEKKLIQQREKHSRLMD